MDCGAIGGDVARIERFFESAAAGRLTEVSVDDCAEIAEAKRAYEALHPETRNGANGGRGGRRNESGVSAFSKRLAEEREVSYRTIAVTVRIGQRIGEDIRARIRGCAVLRPALYRVKSELLALTHHDDRTQARILDEIVAGRAGKIAEAEERLKLRPAPPPRWKRQVHTHKRAWASYELRARIEIFRDMDRTGELERMQALLRDPAAVADIAKGEEYDLDTYMSAAELAALKLPGLPGSKKGVLLLAARSGWRFQDSIGRGGTTRLFSLEDLPFDARVRLERRIAGRNASLGQHRLNAAATRAAGRAKQFPTYIEQAGGRDGAAPGTAVDSHD